VIRTPRRVGREERIDALLLPSHPEVSMSTSAPPLLELTGVHKAFPRRRGEGPVQAVDDISFRVEPGEIVGLLGPNGAGKTTTIKMTCGLIRPDSGVVRVCGHDVARHRHRALGHLSAVLEGNRNLYWRLTARENLEYFAGNRGRSRRSVRAEVDTLLERFRLADKADELVSNLSRGMQQKLAIAVAMMAGTRAVLLDEPTLGLDVETGHEVRALIQEVAAEGRTVVLSSHDMPVVQHLCRRAIVIDRGKVVTDDQVANLLRLFASRAYLVRLAEPLPADRRARLEREFAIADGDDVLSFAVELERGEDLYRLTRALEETGAVVEAIERTTVDFEHVFRQLVRREEPPSGERTLRWGAAHVVA